MIEESATVVGIDGDKIIVEAQVKSTCSSCQAQKNCGTGAVARAFSHRAQTLELHSPMTVRVGDSVVIGLQENSVLVASWWLYLMPILVLASSILMMDTLFAGRLHELLVMLLAILPTYLCFRFVANKLNRLDKGKFQPVLLRRI